MASTGKQGNEKTLIRRVTLLDRLPVYSGPGSGMSAKELTAFLNASDIVCGKRTVERDLKAFIDDIVFWGALGLQLQREQAPDGTALWSHAASSKAVLLKALTRDDALLLSLLEQELKYFLLHSTYATLSQYLVSSRRVLSLPGNRGQSDFRERIRVIPDASLQCLPEPDIGHLQDVNEALLRQEQIEMLYWSSREKVRKSYRLHPVALVKQGVSFWLLAVKNERVRETPIASAVQMFRVDRIVSVARREHDTVVRSLPTLDEALQAGALQFVDKGPVTLRLQFASSPAGAELCQNYREAPLSRDQVIVPGEGAPTELSATVRYSRQLVWMLQAQSHLLRVIEPFAMREEISQFVSKAVAFQR